MRESVLKELEKKDEVMVCRKCGRRVWKYWMKTGMEKDVGEFCAPCLFGSRKN